MNNSGVWAGTTAIGVANSLSNDEPVKAPGKTYVLAAIKGSPEQSPVDTYGIPNPSAPVDG